MQNIFLLVAISFLSGYAYATYPTIDNEPVWRSPFFDMDGKSVWIPSQRPDPIR